jgi:hypothetical protein
MDEVTKSGVKCFNTKITNATSKKSCFGNEVKATNALCTLREPIKPTIVLTNAEESDEEALDNTHKN